MREDIPFKCSCKGVSGVKLIDVGGVKVGIIGMDEIFSEYHKAGKKPEGLDGEEVLEDFRKKNYIAKGSEEVYKEAFLREYRKYFESKQK